MLRAFRGLALGLTLSVLNLCGAFLTLLALGGLGEWTGRQFVGLFGLLEVATGAAFIIGPNVWRLPVSAAELQPGTIPRFAASTILVPHWAGGVKSLAGAALAAWAAAHEGVSPATAGVVPVILFTCAVSVALSMLFARAGCARPDIDVFQVTVRRPGHPPLEFPGMSWGASFVQALLNILTFPSVKLLPPSVLYQPEMAPSPKLLAWYGGFAVVLTVAAFAAWCGRLAWASPVRRKDGER